MTAAPAFAVSVRHGPEALAAMAADWDGCVVATGADIFFTTDWVLTWWAHFGRGRKLVLLCLHDGACGLAGVLALAVETVWAGPLPVRVARLAGGDPNYAILRFPVPAEAAEAAFAALLAEVPRRTDCRILSLSPVSGACPDLAPLRAAAAAAGLDSGPEATDRNHVLMRLPASVEAWWDGLSRSRRREQQRSLKKMQECWRLEHHVSTPATVGADFDRFAALHGAQWAASGRGGHYRDWPGSQAYYRDLLLRLAPKGRGLIEDHLGDGAVLSTQLTFRLGETAYWRLTGRSLAPEVIRTGASRVGMVERIEQLIGAGVCTVELGAGDYDYKLHYGGELVDLHRVALIPQRGAERLQAKALLAWADLVNLLYYRLWFLKLAPRVRQRFGLKPRPLWRHWIRTRL